MDLHSTLSFFSIFIALVLLYLSWRNIAKSRSLIEDKASEGHVKDLENRISVLEYKLSEEKQSLLICQSQLKNVMEENRGLMIEILKLKK